MSQRFYIILVFVVFTCMGLHSQCFPDRHNTSPDEAWLSCLPSTSPNPERGVSHWIMYDLSQIQELGETIFWNYNTPGNLSNGIQELTLDISVDGLNWENAGSFTLDEPVGTSFYEGDVGPDLSGSSARFILLTALSNYGGDCFGLAEIKIGVGDLVSNIAEEEIDKLSLKVSPNPARDFIQLDIGSNSEVECILTITNSLGQQMLTKERKIPSSSFREYIDISVFVSGVYLISIQNSTSISTIELIITK